MITICKVFRFDAAHSLPWHEGKCRHPHGHTYQLEVYAKGNLPAAHRMVMDFSDLAALVERYVVTLCDHKNLNDVFGNEATAENMAQTFLNILHAKDRRICKIRLWEQIAQSFAEAEI